MLTRFFYVKKCLKPGKIREVYEKTEPVVEKLCADQEIQFFRNKYIYDYGWIEFGAHIEKLPDGKFRVIYHCAQYQ